MLLPYSVVVPYSKRYFVGVPRGSMTACRSAELAVTCELENDLIAGGPGSVWNVLGAETVCAELYSLFATARTSYSLLACSPTTVILKGTGLVPVPAFLSLPKRVQAESEGSLY